MKYAIIIADGAADLPFDELDGRTPLEAANTPNIDALAKHARIGTVATAPPGFEAGTDVCMMSVLGYDPREVYTGRAPLEAAALGLELKPKDWVFRVNFVTIGDEGTRDEGLLLDHSAGGISNAETRSLVEGLMDYWRLHEPTLCAQLKLTPGEGSKAILVDSSGNYEAGRDYGAVMTTSPFEVIGQPWTAAIPAARNGSGQRGADAEDVLNRLMELSRVYLPMHPVNIARRSAGKRPANSVWMWGQGVRPSMPSFLERHRQRGAMISAIDVVAGITALIGWDRVDVSGMTASHETDYAAQGRATVEALEQYDVVCCHVAAPDEASHRGDLNAKIESIEAIDTYIVGPVARALETSGDPAKDKTAPGWRILVLPSHYTLVSTRKHDATPVPVLMAGAWVRSAVERNYSEIAAGESDLRIDPGNDLMEYFLRGGLARVHKSLKS